MKQTKHSVPQADIVDLASRFGLPAEDRSGTAAIEFVPTFANERFAHA
jgi:hypothetical protein